MKRKLLFIVALISTSFCVNAQSLQLVYDTKTLTDGDTLTKRVAEMDAFRTVECYVKVKNIGSSKIGISVKREVISPVMPANNETFCWTQCYLSPPPVTDPIDANAGEVLSDFHSIYQFPLAEEGDAVTKYTFFNKANQNDKMSIVIKYTFKAPSAISKVTLPSNAWTVISTGNMIQVNYDFSAYAYAKNMKVVIYNLNGGKVKTSVMNDMTGSVTLSTNDLPEGVYICSIISGNGALTSKKIIVR